MVKTGVGFSLGQDFINIFLLVSYKKNCNFQLSYLKILKFYVKPSNMIL